MANEKRLIDANAFFKEADKALFMGFNAEERKRNFLDMISAMLNNCPTVDAVEVVRCKDCGYWVHVEDGYGDCTSRRFHLDGHPDPTMEFNGFCSCGERKDND